MIRKPSAAGTFYSHNKTQLEREIQLLFEECSSLNPGSARGAICPHAGYQFSGAVAASTLKSCNLKKHIILVGPNHTGRGAFFSIMPQGRWMTPLAEVGINSDMAEAFLNHSRCLEADQEAHRFEHCLEVLVPLLQYLSDDFTIVPILVSTANEEVYRDISLSISQSVKDLQMENEVFIIASSDMSHYVSQQEAKKLDRMAVEAMLQLDSKQLSDKVINHHISMCGVSAACICLQAVKDLGATKAELIDYRTSGQVTGDYDSVVGYAGIKFI